MASSTIGGVVPTATPLPDVPADEPFTQLNWTTLMAIMDTVIPSIGRESLSKQELNKRALPDAEYNAAADDIRSTLIDVPDGDLLDTYLDEKPSSIPRFQELLRMTFMQFVRDDGRKKMAFILGALNTRVGSLMLTGYSLPFHEQPLQIRESILEGWRVAYLPPLNAVYKIMTTIGKSVWLKSSPTYARIAGVPSVPAQYEPGPDFPFEFIQFGAGSEPAVFETDVVIVGSGCGGAVCAKNLAESGQRVLVLEKAYYYPPSQLPMKEDVGWLHLFENGGVESTDDGSLGMIAGAAWGGGGTVNWSASLQTQAYVRKEWAVDRGLTFFETMEFQNCLDRVCHRMGVSADHIRHNHANQMLLEGSRKLGYHAKAVPQNTGGHEHYCGHCSIGCGAAQKQGPAVTWLPDAARAGAKFAEGFQVDKVLFDESSGRKVAIGVKGTWTSRDTAGGVYGPGRVVREVIVRAKKVIVSCGTLWSPIVLMNSGLDNPQIGRNLYLHPVNTVAAVYKEDVRPWEGGILTSVCTSFENLDGHGHGVKLETSTMLPSFYLPLLNWNSGLDYKSLVLKLRHMVGFIAIARDRDTGRVYKDPTSGRPRYAYTPSAYDRVHLMEGIIALSKIAYVTGATEIHAAISGLAPFIRPASSIPPSSSASTETPDPGVTDPIFCAWLEELERIGNKPPAGAYPCAHQMGSNRMSVYPQDGVVDPQGRVWGTEGLYVSDASIFPSASGVNPMVTNMAISDWISRGIAREMRAEGRVEARL